MPSTVINLFIVIFIVWAIPPITTVIFYIICQFEEMRLSFLPPVFFTILGSVLLIFSVDMYSAESRDIGLVLYVPMIVTPYITLLVSYVVKKNIKNKKEILKNEKDI